MISCGIFQGDTLGLLALEVTPGAAPADINDYDALPMLAGSQITHAGESETIDMLRGTMTPQGDSPGSSYWDISIDTPLYGGGTALGALVDMPLDKALQCAGMIKEDALVVPIGSGGVTGSWAVGDWVKDASSAIFGYVAGVDNTASPKLLLVYNATTANAPASAEAITIESGGTATVSATPYEAFNYRYVSDCASQKTGAVKWYEGDILHTSTYSRFNLDMNFPIGKSAKFSLKGIGLYNAPADGTQPVDKLPPTGVTIPSCVGMSLYVGSYAPQDITALDIKSDAAPSIDEHLSAATGYSGTSINSRRPMCSFDAKKEPLLSTYDAHGAAVAGTTAQIVARLGTVAGNRFHLVMPAGQARRPKPSEKNKKLTYGYEFLLTGSADDELFLFYY